MRTGVGRRYPLAKPRWAPASWSRRNGENAGDTGDSDSSHDQGKRRDHARGGEPDLRRDVSGDADALLARVEAEAILRGSEITHTDSDCLNTSRETSAPDNGIPRSSAPRERTSAVFPLLLLTDILATTFALVLGLILLSFVSAIAPNSLHHLAANIKRLAPMPVAMVIAYFTYGLYRRTRRQLRPNAFAEGKDLIHAIAAGGFITLGISVALHRLFGTVETSPAQLASACITAALIVPVARSTTRRLLERSRSSRMRVIVVGSGMVATRLSGYLASEPGIEVIGMVDNNPMPGSPVLGGISDLPELCKANGVDRVLISFSQTHPRETVELLRGLHDHVSISIVPRYFDLLSWRSQVDEIRGLPVIDVAPPDVWIGNRLLKRAFDIAVSSVGILLLSPLLAMLAILVKMTSPGPVFFHQQRVGRNRQAFTMYKLRSMRVGAEAERASLSLRNDVDGPLFKAREDPRMTPLGRILRRTSLDELPQLFNVLKGDMSLVGPRPFIQPEADRISGWAARRFESRPGITGLWQVSGRSNLSYDELCRLDYLYVASWSLWWDIKILWQTPAMVMRKEGAY